MSNLLLNNSNFIHIPKCGGTFVQSFLYRLNLVKFRHQRPQNGHLFLHQMPENGLYTFTFVRHPYTWWPSFWNWSKRDRFSFMERECPDFDTWIQEYGPFWMGLYTRLMRRYIGEDPVYKSKNKVNFIGKNENIDHDLLNALINANESISEEFYWRELKSAEHQNSKYLNTQEYNRNISDASKKIIYRTEKYVFDRFNYES